jgi:hypothetical protein
VRRAPGKIRPRRRIVRFVRSHKGGRLDGVAGPLYVGVVPDAEEQSLPARSKACGSQTLAEVKRWNLQLQASSTPVLYLAGYVVIAFHLSSDAAIVRLRQLGFVR